MRPREGPLLALGCLGAVLGTVLLVLAMTSNDPVLVGSGFIVLGFLIALAARPLSDAFAHLAWPPLPWPIWVAFGGALIVAGIVGLTTA